MYSIRFAVGVTKELEEIPTFHRNAIFDAIETQLSHEPTTQTKRRKILKNLMPPWEAVPPIWELRVGLYRVFYDVSEEEKRIYVRAIRKKPLGKRTEEIL